MSSYDILHIINQIGWWCRSHVTDATLVPGVTVHLCLFSAYEHFSS